MALKKNERWVIKDNYGNLGADLELYTTRQEARENIGWMGLENENMDVVKVKLVEVKK